MNEPYDGPPPTRDEMMSALFANLVIQQANTALVFLGVIPHPETGQRMCDLETAQLFVDQLEMLELKTKGNLNAEEAELLNKCLTEARMAFVHMSNQQTGAPQSAAPAPDTTAKPVVAVPAPEEDSRKKFSKSY